MLLLAFLSATQFTPPVVHVDPPFYSVIRGQRTVMTPTQALQTGMVRLSAEEAVIKAAAADTAGVIGVFDIHTVIADELRERVFLGTQPDYRNQRNLAIAIEPSAMRDLMTRYGAPLTTVLKGKHLLVGGRARPVQIAFTENGRPTGKYYFQTHVVVTHANQIEIVGD